jgi:hypothetical protein
MTISCTSAESKNVTNVADMRDNRKPSMVDA